MPTVVLYAHNLGQRDPTGIGHYSKYLIRGILDLDTTGMGIAYRIGASPDSHAAGPGPADLQVLRPKVPRKALHLAWTAIGRPNADRSLERPDLIHVLTPFTPLPSKARLVFTVHDLWPLTNPDWYTAKERWMFAKAIAQATERATTLIANSRATADNITATLGIDPDRIRVVHMAIDKQYFSPSSSEEIARVCEARRIEPGRYIVALGTVSTRKNLGPVIEAVARLSARSRGVTLVAAGPAGLGFEKTELLVQKLGISEHVRFTGWLPASELLPLLNGAAALVHPSADEGFGMTPLEAMACRVPTAVSSAGALPEVTAGCSLLVDPYDADAWAGAIDRLLDDDVLRADLIERGRIRAACFTWDRVVAETVEVHRAALEL